MKDRQTARNQRRRQLREQLTARRSLVDLLIHPAEHTTDTGTPGPRAPPNPAGPKTKLYRED